jgi:tetratricopeptide (TPR) repeat protein
VQRYLIRKPKTEIFVFSEKEKTADSIFKKLKAFLIGKGDFGFLSDYEKIKEAEHKVAYLAAQITKYGITPFFVFDNLEDFQETPGEAFKQEYASIENIISFLIQNAGFPLILTARYPLKISNGNKLKEFDLNTVSFADYWRKARYLNNITDNCEKNGQSFYETVQFLFETFGGNYRALEFYDKLSGEQKPGQIIPELEAFKAQNRKQTNAVLQEMSKNLLFEKLIQLLNEKQLNALYLLSFFSIPVTGMSLVLQGMDETEIKTLLDRPLALTLIEKQRDVENSFSWYYVSPLIKGLLANLGDLKTTVTFSPENAGRYHLSIFNNNINQNISQIEHAFSHFHKAKNNKHISDLGEKLSRFYYGNNLYNEALFFATRAFDFLKEDCPSGLLNRIGLIFHMFGKYDFALRFFQLNLKKQQEIGDKSGEGTTLNNLATTAYAKGDYETALKYLEQSLAIRQEIGDKSGEATTLFNLAMTYLDPKINQPEKGVVYLIQVEEINKTLQNAEITNALAGIFKQLGIDR